MEPLNDNQLISLRAAPQTEADVRTLVGEYFDDHELYHKTFFPNTCRQASAQFHADMDNLLWAGHRKVGIKVFRDGAKTTRVRLFMSKRIAYAISRTILYISKGEDYAEATISWLKNQVEKNTKWASFYGLTPGKVWTSTDIEIVNSVAGTTCRIVAAGIHGQVRGLNLDDYRPDLIVCDDIEDEKSVNTEEQIRKHTALLFGSVMRSLASPVDNPDAMIVIIQTPLHTDDAIESAFRDRTFKCLAVSCFAETEDGIFVSSWGAKWPLDFLLSEKESYIDRNILSLWLREMEVTVTSPESRAFKPEWLQLYDTPPTDYDELILTVDPASSDSKDADFQAVGLTGKAKANAVVLGYGLSRGNDVETSAETVFNIWDRMLVIASACAKRPNLRMGVENIGYQRVLNSYLRKEMARRGRYMHVEALGDKRTKEDMIRQELTPVASNHALYCAKSHREFREQFESYPQVRKDDLIDTIARGVGMMNLSGAGGNLHTGGEARQMATQALITRHAQRLIPSMNRSYLGRIR